MNPLSLIVTALCALALAGCSRQHAVEAKQDLGPVRVRTAPVVTRELQRHVEAVGSLFPFEEIVISSEIDGRVEQVNFDLGDRVNLGDIMVRVSDEEQRYIVAQNEAQLRQSLERLGLKDEGEKIGDIRQTPDVRRAQADLTEAENRFRRVRELAAQETARHHHTRSLRGHGEGAPGERRPVREVEYAGVHHGQDRSGTSAH
jgi:multidrug efflux pump subunit AcrA (membrane-fusion protein)